MDIGGVLGAVSGIGSALSGMGGGVETTPQVQGFSAMPQEVQDWILEQVFPQIRGELGRSRPTGIMRQYTQAEANDPIFGSKSRMYMQDTMNQQAFDKMLRELMGGKQEEAAASDFSPQDAIFIKQYESGQLPANQYAREYQDALQRRASAGKIPLPMGGYYKQAGTQ